MAGTGYGYRGHSAYNGGRPHSDEWNKADHAAEYVCRRTIITDPDGKTRTIISCSRHSDPESYVATTETNELVYTTLTPEYRHGSPKGYRHGSPKRYRHSSPVHDSPRKVEELLSKLQIETSRPNRHDHNSTRHHGTPGYKSDHDYKKNKEFHNPNNYDKKRTTAPTLSPPQRSTHQSTKPNGSLGYDDYYYDKNNTTEPKHGPRPQAYHSTKPDGTLGYSDYSEYSDSDEDELHKPSANYRRHDGGVDHFKHGNTEPLRTGGLARPSHATVTTPHKPNNKLSLLTNNIDEAIGYLKGSKPLSDTSTHPTTRFSKLPKQVDRLEAVEGHDKYQSSSRPETKGRVMTSYEVAKKYNGKLVRI